MGYSGHKSIFQKSMSYLNYDEKEKKIKEDEPIIGSFDILAANMTNEFRTTTVNRNTQAVDDVIFI